MSVPRLPVQSKNKKTKKQKKPHQTAADDDSD